MNIQYKFIYCNYAKNVAVKCSKLIIIFENVHLLNYYYYYISISTNFYCNRSKGIFIKFLPLIIEK